MMGARRAEGYGVESGFDTPTEVGSSPVAKKAEFGLQVFYFALEVAE